MRKSIFALAVVAAALPGLAFAGEPVPMTDTEMDKVVAGLDLQDLLNMSVSEILNHPQYKPQTDAAVLQYNLLSPSDKADVAEQVAIGWATLTPSQREHLAAIAPEGLKHLIPPAQQ
jgi:hypothetical protein